MQKWIQVYHKLKLCHSESFVYAQDKLREELKLAALS